MPGHLEGEGDREGGWVWRDAIFYPFTDSIFRSFRIFQRFQLFYRFVASPCQLFVLSVMSAGMVMAAGGVNRKAKGHLVVLIRRRQEKEPIINQQIETNRQIHIIRKLKIC